MEGFLEEALEDFLLAVLDVLLEGETDVVAVVVAGFFVDDVDVVVATAGFFFPVATDDVGGFLFVRVVLGGMCVVIGFVFLFTVHTLNILMSKDFLQNSNDFIRSFKKMIEQNYSEY